MKKVITRVAAQSFSISFYNKLRYFYNHKKWPDLNQPTTFTEKFLKYKIDHFDPLMTVCADKYAVREYVGNKVGSDVLIPLLAHYKTAKEFELDYVNLPSSFALKGAHGSGWNEIVFEKDKLNLNLTLKKVKEWLGQNYYDYGRELQYRDIPPSIVVEELLSTDDGKVPVDYKFYCFGRSGCKKIIVQVDVDRFSGDHRRVFYTENWNESDIAILSPKAGRDYSDYPKPDNLEKMVSIAKSLSQDFEFSRIDLYDHNGKVYFGEITFHPESAYGMFIKPASAEKELLTVFEDKN